MTIMSPLSIYWDAESDRELSTQNENSVIVANLKILKTNICCNFGENKRKQLPHCQSLNYYFFLSVLKMHILRH